MNHHLIQPNQTIIIGYSGGPDSTYLLHAIKKIKTQLNLKLIAAHLDHQWRPNSAADVIFCREQAAALGIQFVSSQAKELDIRMKPNGSQEEFGRKLRRAFFTKIAKEYKADAIALGHHADDQLETFFIRLMRGATLSGLTCMKPIEGMYIRPLLGLHKKEIFEYLNTHNIPFIIDPTNESANYLRNRIRLSVVPALQTADSRFTENFFRGLEHLQQAEELLNQITKKELAACKIDSGLQKDTLLIHQPYLIKRILIAWLIEHKVPFTPSDGFLNEMIRFISQPATKKQHPLHEQWMLCKNDNVLTIEKLTPAFPHPSSQQTQLSSVRESLCDPSLQQHELENPPAL